MPSSIHYSHQQDKVSVAYQSDSFSFCGRRGISVFQAFDAGFLMQFVFTHTISKQIMYHFYADYAL